MNEKQKFKDKIIKFLKQISRIYIKFMESVYILFFVRRGMYALSYEIEEPFKIDTIVIDDPKDEEV
jgi:hypothetical protein